MIKRLSIPILGLIENMSWFQPNDSDKKYYLFGKGGGKELAAEYKIELLAQLPLIEKSEDQEIHDSETINKTFNDTTDKIVQLLKTERSNKLDSIPQTNITK